jgi:diguanylate cyclase (GGDEF)-like protein/PAS domain S-box-containing protein
MDQPLASADAAHLPAATNPAERLVEAIDLPMGRWDRAGRLEYCNQPYLRWAGRSRTELLGHTLEELYGAAAWEAAKASFAAAFEGRTVSYERRLTHRGASARWARVQIFPSRDEQGAVEAVYTIAFDVHDDVVEREALRAARVRLDRFTDHIPYPLVYVDHDFKVSFVNKAYTEVTGMRADQMLGHHIGLVRGPLRWAEHQPHYERALAGETSQYTRLVDGHPLGPRWLRTSYVPDYSDDGAVVGVYTVTVDVHELAEAQQRLQRTVERDELTQVLSRRAMMSRLEGAIAQAAVHPFALYFIDLDGFKALNDQQGHAAGDALLAAVGRELQATVRNEDAVGRFGGDEFLVIGSVGDAAAAQTLADHLLQTVCDCAARCSPSSPVSASIGYALAPQDAAQPLRLLQLADDAMYEAKRRGKHRTLHSAVLASRA